MTFPGSRIAEPRRQAHAVSALWHCPLEEDVKKKNVRSKVTLSYDFCPFYPKNVPWVHSGLYILPPSAHVITITHVDCSCLQGSSLLWASSPLVIHSLPLKLLLKNLDLVISLPCSNFISESPLPVGFLNMINRLENRSVWVRKWCYLYKSLLFFQAVTWSFVCDLSYIV